MSEKIDDEDNKIKESSMGSINHSLAQARLTSLLDSDERFTVLTELSLDVSQHDFSKYGVKARDEIKPDICLYPNTMDFHDLDIVKMTDIPLLAIEILSPNQGTKELKGKIYAYFELGVKSCWLVVPDAKLISVYTKQGDFKNFDMSDTEVIDETMDIHLPIDKLFKRRTNHGPV